MLLAIFPTGRTRLAVSVDIQGPGAYQQYGEVAEITPDLAPCAHFDGPLTVQWHLPPGGLQRGNEPTDIRVSIGTVDKQKGCMVGVEPAFPNGVYPFVDVEFPPKNEADPPIRQRYPLDKFC